MKKYVILWSILFGLSPALFNLTFAQAPRNPKSQTTTSEQTSKSGKADKTAEQSQSKHVYQAVPETKTTTPTSNDKRAIGPQGQGTTPSHVTRGTTTPPGRGYTSDGHPQPQPAPKSGNPTPAPYFHPNDHGYGYHVHVPRRLHPVYFEGLPYYYVDGVYCTLINGVYIICRPPLGVVINRNIWHSMQPVIVFFNSTIYYYDDGSYFLPNNGDGYVVVAPPIGAKIAELPSNYEEIILDDNTYYKVENTYYKLVITNGCLWYEVVGKTIN